MAVESDALVFFGATGDLAYKQVFPALLSLIRRGGVETARLVIDPGLGFGKRKEENSRLLADLGLMAKFDLPVLVGPSRKSFLAQSTPETLLMATARIFRSRPR